MENLLAEVIQDDTELGWTKDLKASEENLLVRQAGIASMEKSF